jgi:hypothetical protein
MVVGLMGEPIEVYSRRSIHCLRAPIRFKLTEDEEMFVRHNLAVALREEALPAAPADVDDAYRYTLDRLTVAGYRALRTRMAVWHEEIRVRMIEVARAQGH